MNNYKIFFELYNTLLQNFELCDFYPGKFDNLVLDFSILNKKCTKINAIINFLIKNNKYNEIITSVYFDYTDADVLTIYFNNIDFTVFKNYYDKNIIK